MTEASHQMTSNPLPKHGERRPGTVGKAQGSVQVAILDEQCNVLPPGQVRGSLAPAAGEGAAVGWVRAGSCRHARPAAHLAFLGLEAVSWAPPAAPPHILGTSCHPATGG